MKRGCFEHYAQQKHRSRSKTYVIKGHNTYIFGTTDGLWRWIGFTGLAIEKTILADTIRIIGRDVDQGATGNDCSAIGEMQVLYDLSGRYLHLLRAMMMMEGDERKKKPNKR